MNKVRLESFSDGVMAIIITIMVFNLKPPMNDNLDHISKFLLDLSCYVESFFIIGIFWYHHNKLFSVSKNLSRGTVLMNNTFLFSLSLIPVVTSWATANPEKVWPRVAYGTVLLFCFMTFFSLKWVMSKKISKKIKFLIFANALSIAVAFYSPWMAYFLFAILGLCFLVVEEKYESIA